MNLYDIKDETVQEAIRDFGNVLKYVCETNYRSKNSKRAKLHYRNYILSLLRLKGETKRNKDGEELYRYLPEFDAFFDLIMCGDSDRVANVGEATREFLEYVVTYLNRTYKSYHEIHFYPFYFEQSFENRKDRCSCKTEWYVENYLITELKYSKEELEEQKIVVCSNEVLYPCFNRYSLHNSPSNYPINIIKFSTIKAA